MSILVYIYYLTTKIKITSYISWPTILVLAGQNSLYTPPPHTHTFSLSAPAPAPVPIRLCIGLYSSIYVGLATIIAGIHYNYLLEIK